MTGLDVDVDELVEVAVVITDYDPQWPPRFEAARSAITRAVGGLLVPIEHVGSTAIPGLAAKPIIDIVMAKDDRGFLDKRVVVEKEPIEEGEHELRAETGLSGEGLGYPLDEIIVDVIDG